MANIAVVAPPYLGHLQPLEALAAELQRRGHQINFVHRAGSEPIAGRSGLLGIRRTLKHVSAATDALCAELPRRLREMGAELVLADQTEAAGGLVARHLRLPLVSVANALPLNEEPGVPPPFLGWHLDSSARGERRNRGGYRVARMLSTPLNRVIARHARAWRLGDLRTLVDCLSPSAQISQIVRALDFPRRELPSCFTYVGPLRAPEAGTMEPALRGAQVFISLGTLQGHRLDLLAAMAKACDALGLRCIVAHGGRLSAAQAASFPGNAVVRAFVPQRAVLREVSATLSHGGLNTVLDSLAASVPMVLVPLAFEQAATAARVVHHGAGRVVSSRRFHTRLVAELAAALNEVLSGSAYRRGAADIGAHIASSGGTVHAASIVEQSLSAACAPA